LHKKLILKRRICKNSKSIKKTKLENIIKKKLMVSMGFLDKLKRDIEYKVRSKTSTTTSKATAKREANKFGKSLLKKIKKGLTAKKIKMKHIDNFEEFKEKFEKEGDKPEMTVFFYLIGVLEYITGDKKQGEPMITLTVKKDYMHKDPTSPSGLKLPQAGEGYFIQHMLEDPNIIKSFLGGNPENNYTVDKDELVMTLVDKDVKKNYAVIDIQSGGKDIYSRVKLQKNRHGIWKLYSTSSIATGVKVTAEEQDDF